MYVRVKLPRSKKPLNINSNGVTVEKLQKVDIISFYLFPPYFGQPKKISVTMLDMDKGFRTSNKRSKDAKNTHQVPDR